MADIPNGGDRLHVPAWLMPTVCGVLVLIGGTGIKTWADTNSNSHDLTNHESRLITVEGKIGTIQQDVAVIRQQLTDEKQRNRESSDKIDRILSLEMARSHK